MITKCLLLQRGQVFHQAAFAAGGVVFMNNTFLSSLIQNADRDLGCLNGAFLLTCLDCQTGLFYKCTRAGRDKRGSVRDVSRFAYCA